MKRMSLVFAILALFAFSLAYAQTETAQEAPKADEAKADETKPQEQKGEIDPATEKAWKQLQIARANLKTFTDYTATFYKKEWKDGKQLPQEKIFMKWRRTPRAVYMKWIGDVDKGQETIWVKGKNNNKIKAHAGGILGAVNVNLDPKGSMAMKKSRHTVDEAGFDHTVELIYRDLKLSIENPTWNVKVVDLGEKTIFGRKSVCFESNLPKDKHPKYYGYKARICMDKQLKIPNRVKIWDYEDGKVRLIEDYGYENVKLNAGLTDKDFDPENPEYSF